MTFPTATPVATLSSPPFPTPTAKITARPSSSESSQVSPGTDLSDPFMSPAITIAPVASNKFELRQKCWNDQGFSVDCATWTGYYYTWGPPGNPYQGGPGEGNPTVSYTVVYVPSRACRTSPLGGLATALIGCAIFLVLYLWECDWTPCISRSNIRLSGAFAGEGVHSLNWS